MHIYHTFTTRVRTYGCAVDLPHVRLSCTASLLTRETRCADDSHTELYHLKEDEKVERVEEVT
jgi:hypothetical protein